jgi:hypothetical protein
LDANADTDCYRDADSNPNSDTHRDRNANSRSRCHLCKCCGRQRRRWIILERGFLHLQSALNIAVRGDQIWLAAGVYKPGDSGERSATFQLKNGVALYGGFAGTESVLAGRDWMAHVTVLSGDIDGNDTTDATGVVTDSNKISGANSYHVVTGSGTGATAVLDGFTISAGNASSSTSSDARGGGMFNLAGSPTVNNVSFIGNRAFENGGGMFNDGSSPALTNVSFSRNRTAGFSSVGGGMFNTNSSSPSLTNVTFSVTTLAVLALGWLTPTAAARS